MAIYLGPIAMTALGYRLVLRIIRLAKAQNITSIADFIAARYGKHQGVAALVALIGIVGTADGGPAMRERLHLARKHARCKIAVRALLRTERIGNVDPGHSVHHSRNCSSGSGPRRFLPECSLRHST